MSPYLFPLTSPSHPPYPTPLGGHRARSRSPCAMWLLPISYLFYLFYIWKCIYVHDALSLHPSLPYPVPSFLFDSCHHRFIIYLFIYFWSFLFYLFIYLFFKHLYWSIIALQWCVSFCFITK